MTPTGRAPVRRASAWEAALGEDAAALHPRIREYVRAVPPGCVGVGAGTFAEAGCRRRWLVPAFAVAARWGIAFPEHGADVRFTIENRGDARGGITATRTFRFPQRARTMRDRVRAGRGCAVDALGDSGRVEAQLVARAIDGELRLTSGAVRVRLGPVWITLPAALRPRITLVERWDGSVERQHVDLRVALPVLGVVYGYRGHFDYRIEPSEAP